MAVYLKKRHHLLALKLSLRREGRVWVVHLDLETHAGDEPRTLATFRMPTENLGLPRYVDATSAPSFFIPGEVTGDLRERIAELQLEPSHPLWLHLVKPYGYLGVVPWEDLLVPELQRPVLRLPDFLEPARERRDTLDVALCCCVPASERSFPVPQALGEIAAAVLRGSRRPHTRIHVFPDIGSFAQVRDAFEGEPRVSVHDPSAARRYLGQRIEGASASAVTSPWLQWMRDAMEGRSLDTVHFVCRGYFADERPCLTVTESPAESQDARTARYLGVAETSTFLNQTGAWSVVCTAPPDGSPELGLRYFVDTLAQVRPGPALFHDSNRDDGLVALQSAYEFLFSPDPREAIAGPLFMYCQPALVDTQLPVEAKSALGATIVSFNSDLFNPPVTASDSEKPRAAPDRKRAKRMTQTEAISAPSEEAPADSDVPNWLSSTQRFVEEQMQEAQRRDASLGRAPNPRMQARTSAIAETLADVQSIIKSFAASRLKP
ncbi:MAG: hypothetical protein MNPFHGCM_00266 [Gemmatimonadaceae bacterium]|nr:hypothetical protein [Gemmatimonadaceae bacterium]